MIFVAHMYAMYALYIGFMFLVERVCVYVYCVGAAMPIQVFVYACAFQTT